MTSRHALINVQKRQSDFGREADVLIGGIVQRAVDNPGYLEAGDSITASWPLKDVSKDAVPNGSLRAAFHLYITGGVWHCNKHFVIVLFPTVNVSTSVCGI